MTRVELTVNVAFHSDAVLFLYYRDVNNALKCAYSFSTPTSEGTNDYNLRYQMNLTPTEHRFTVDLPDGSEPDYDQSYIEFGFKGQRDLWIGPGKLKTIYLSEIEITFTRH